MNSDRATAWAASDYATPVRSIASVTGLLVIDTDPASLSHLCDGLAALGHGVEGFTSLTQAKAKGALRRARLVLVHVSPADADLDALGLNLASELRHCPFVVVSPASGRDAMAAALGEATIDYVVAPVTLEVIDRRVRLAQSGSGAGTAQGRLRLTSGQMVPGTPYRLERWMGEGGMGAVFEAVHVDIERRVAIKILHAEHCRDDRAVQTFRNEARASGRIGAPNIAETLDLLELSDGRLMIAMEFLDGSDLDSVLKKGPLSLPRVIAIGRQVCKALHAAHQSNVIHRDVKPDNIMLVEREGRSDFVKVVDFGIAVFVADPQDAGTAAGTPGYIAPEVISGLAVDARADMYSFGCVLFRMITGRHAYDGETAMDILRTQLSQPLPPPSTLADPCPERLDALVARCTAANPEERFADMAAVEAELCEVQIELDMFTGWDTLPLPEVDDQRRASLLDRMPDPEQHRPRSRTGRFTAYAVVGALAITIGAVVGLRWRVPEPAVAVDPGDPRSERVESLTKAAYTAAGRFYFVYPPVQDPGGSTAYAEVQALEGLEWALADSRAQQLRGEFAETLVRLGDRYWSHPNARPFSREYYAQALMFDDGNERALERAGLTPVALADLKSRAASGTFSEFELVAVEPLVALAEPDEAAQREQLTKTRRRSRSASANARLDALIGTESSNEANVTPPGGHANPDAAEFEAAEEDKEGPQPSARRDPARAKSLIRAGDKKLKARALEQAEQLYRQALDADARAVGALDGLGDVYFERADYKRSAKYREQAVKLRPRGGRYIDLGDALFKINRLTDARSAYQDAKQKGHADADGRIARVDRKLGG